MKYLPIVIITLLVCILGYVLYLPKVPGLSPMQGKPVPSFQLPTLEGSKNNFITSKDFENQYFLLNIFASWCQACEAEHPALLYLNQKNILPIVGIAWRDSPEKLQSWIQEHGNPYTSIGLDTTGEAVITLGVSGAPESFLISPAGTIIYHHIGPLTQHVIDTIILPLISTEQP